MLHVQAGVSCATALLSGKIGVNKFVTVQERGPFSELQTALVLYECVKVIASCHVSLLEFFPTQPLIQL